MHLPRPALLFAALCALTLAPSLGHAQSSSTRERERERERARERERERDRDRDTHSIRAVRISVERRDRMPDREITMSVGALRSQDDGVHLPMAALRTDWRLRRWLRSEVGVSYAIGSIDRLENGTVPTDSRTLQLATGTVGLRAEVPWQVVKPYVGVAAGLVFRNEEGGDEYVRTTMAFPAGVRIVLSDRVSLRGEARFRFDQRRSGSEGVRVEQTGGLSVTF